MVEYKEMTPETERDIKLFSHTVLYLYKQGGSVVRDGIEIENTMQLALNLMKQVPETTEFQAVELVFLGLGADELNDPLIMERLKQYGEISNIIYTAETMTEDERRKAESSGSVFRYLLGLPANNSIVLYDKPLPENRTSLSDLINNAYKDLFGRKPEEYEKPFKLEYEHNGEIVRIACYVSKPLTAIHQSIFTALGDLYINGYRKVTYEILWKMMGHENSPNAERRKFLKNEVEYMMGVVVWIDNQEEIQANLPYKEYKFNNVYQLVNVFLRPDDYKGREVDFINISELPIFYAFAYDRNQIITLPRTAVREKIKFVNLDLLIEKIVLNRIHQIKYEYEKFYEQSDIYPYLLDEYNRFLDKQSKGQSTKGCKVRKPPKEPVEPENKISIHTIYEKCGIPTRAWKTDTASDKQKATRDRQKVRKLVPVVLEELVKCGTIRHYAPYTKSKRKEVKYLPNDKRKNCKIDSYKIFV